jgi:predicted RNase H-like HicB family nuclease
MPDACYYSLIERTEDGRFFGWVPDLPETTAEGLTEQDVIRQLSRLAQERLHDLLMQGQSPPRARSADDLPEAEGERAHRRLLLIIG